MRRTIDELIGLTLYAARRFPDERGFLLQSYVASRLKALGIGADFKQAIQSRSRRGVVRGMHFQWDPPQGKLIRCVTGAILDVVVDIRHASPTLGDHVAVALSEANDQVLWIPPGFAHGFMALAEDTTVFYECTEEWNAASEGGILWCDPDLGIEWPALDPIVSPKDSVLPCLADWLKDPRSGSFRISSDGSHE
jgi:dTDP-4-dehydrorhamnose 3,5-epimerase